MTRLRLFDARLLIVLTALIISGCTSSANSRYFGSSKPSSDNRLRYITGSEPATLDPHVSGGQPEARIYGALYEGLVEYHPKTLQPIPALAERWEASPKVDEFIFYLRKNGKFSDGKPITAHDFVYSFRRGFDPNLISQTVSLGYFVKYAEAYNGHQHFIERDGKFITENELSDTPTTVTAEPAFGPDSDFHKFIKSPQRATVPGDALKRAQTIEPNPKLKEIFQFRDQDIRNPAGLVAKLRNATDPLSKRVAESVGASGIQCSGDCAEARSAIATGLNKLSDSESLFAAEWFASLQLPEEAGKLAESIAAENKKRSDANAKVDQEIAKQTEPAKAAELEKSKRKMIGKLFYANRFLLEQAFAEELAPVNLVPVKAGDIGIEAIDDHTLRITLRQSAPFFLGLLTHQFFRVVPSQSIEKHGKHWTRPENIVTSGPFRVKQYYPYDRLIVERDPNYWDRENVHLDAIDFYPVEELTTMLGLYKSGAVDALLNHSVPTGWLDVVSQYKDEWMNLPESATSYYSFNMKKPPFDNPKVRQAFALSIDREALSAFRKVTKPLYYYSPSGIFPDYDRAMAKVSEEIRQERGLTPEQWDRQRKLFDPELARKLLTEAGFPVTGSDGKFECPTFPTDKVSLTYNKGENNQAVAEFIQAQWARNIGVTVPLKNMEFKTFLADRNALRYEGLAQSLWAGDYMDPFTFLGLHYAPVNDGGSGFHDPKYDKMLDDANSELDPQKRNEMLARAEFYLVDQMPALPLTINATNWVKKPWVKGMYPNASSLFAWKFVYIERDPAKWDTDVNGIMERDDPKVVEQLKQLEASATK